MRRIRRLVARVEDIIASIWFVPAAIAIGCVVAAIILIQVSTRVGCFPRSPVR